VCEPAKAYNRLRLCTGQKGCGRISEKVTQAVARGTYDVNYPAAASYSRQYLSDDTTANGYLEYEITKLANQTKSYISDYTFAGQVGDT
jgi:hypothetical protein